MAIALLAAACATDNGTPCPSATIISPDGQDSVCLVGVARTAEERMAGLFAYPDLATGQGLYFEFPAEGELCFHTEGLDYTITVVWVRTDGQIAAVETLPPDTPGTCRGPAQYVLEVLPVDASAAEVGGSVVTAF